MAVKKLFPCPVCGSLVFEEKECSYDICPVCGWVEDGYQQWYPDETGPNLHWTLNAAREAWEKGEAIFKGYPNPRATKP